MITIVVRLGQIESAGDTLKWLRMGRMVGR